MLKLWERDPGCLRSRALPVMSWVPGDNTPPPHPCPVHYHLLLSALLTVSLLINWLSHFFFFKSAQQRVLVFVLTLKLEKPHLFLSSRTSTGDLLPYLLLPFFLILYLPSFHSVPGPVFGGDRIKHTGRGPCP